MGTTGGTSIGPVIPILDCRLRQRSSDRTNPRFLQVCDCRCRMSAVSRCTYVLLPVWTSRNHHAFLRILESANFGNKRATIYPC